MDFTSHAPVMLEESVDLVLSERALGSGATIVDATFGAGGHTKEILSRQPSGRVIALDADPAAVVRAVELSSRYPGRLTAVHSNFADLDEALEELGVDGVDGILYDLGLSSIQLADAERGFSFAGDEPLDMRLDPTTGDPSAADLLNTLSERELADLIHANGDERFARRIARQIVTRRARSPLRKTSDLVAAILAALPRNASRGKIHPATRTFQALRMAVNHDVERLERSLAAAARRLRPGARAVVISYHSGEDRSVKRTFRRWEHDGLATVITRKPMTPTVEETKANPRSRSAKLRAAERLSAQTEPPHEITEDRGWR
ncbi:MAG TPA: 16S rRNA (cytosine(1402)-N(4))-methyltransferase RsmH [Candidatus Eremiobacteraceae bacterium]|nr:16S rRNA (cytosine(1402)-N(4))-methyltransferase RsmH [Candidatus Eremiobacteraceae bacterium]